MSVGINPVDGLPEFKNTRKVVTERQKRRAAKRAQRFVMAEWGGLTRLFRALSTDRASRLLLVVYLHRNLQAVRANGGWIELEQKDLTAMGIADENLHRDVAKLEATGGIEVRRRPGKRPLLRLIDNQELCG